MGCQQASNAVDLVKARLCARVWLHILLLEVRKVCEAIPKTHLLQESDVMPQKLITDIPSRSARPLL